jgi:hypothetical protein
MQDTVLRNALFFDTIINGGVVAHVAKEAGLVPESVRRIFLRECMKRSPTAYASGVLACKGAEPSIAWIKANAELFKSEQVQIGQEAIEELKAIRSLEERGYKVSGGMPFSLSTPLSAFAILTPRQREYFARKGILTIADSANLNEEELELASDSPRQLHIIKQLIELAR